MPAVKYAVILKLKGYKDYKKRPSVTKCDC